MKTQELINKYQKLSKALEGFSGSEDICNNILNDLQDLQIKECEQLIKFLKYCRIKGETWILEHEIEVLAHDYLQLELIYKGYIIKPNDYPHPEYKYTYYHEDETDGFVNICKTIDECKQEIDTIHEELENF